VVHEYIASSRPFGPDSHVEELYRLFVKYFGGELAKSGYVVTGCCDRGGNEHHTLESSIGGIHKHCST
jgi:hypothetical protein